MPLKIGEISYLTVLEVLREMGITRQTLWRWRQEGRIPPGRRFRNRQVIFSPDEAAAIRSYANRVEVIQTDEANPQLSLLGATFEGQKASNE